MRKVFLDDLPRNRTRINWVKSVGYKVRFIYDDIEGDVKIIKYDIDKQQLTIEHKDKTFDIKTVHFSKGKFGNMLCRYTSEFKLNIGETLEDNKRNLIIIDREYRKKVAKDSKGNVYLQKDKWYRYFCNKCNYKYWMIEGSLTRGNGCVSCAGNLVVEGINDITTKAPWMVRYFQGGVDEAKRYSCQSGKKIYPICPDCNQVKDKAMIISNIYKRKSINCICGDGKSYPSKFMFNVLKQLNLEFDNEVKFDWCSFPNYTNREKISIGWYDFVIDDLKIIIEVDGGFHVTDNKMNDRKKEESQYIDFMKDKLAIKNGYKIIRVKCVTSNMDEIKENILKSELVDIFDLSQIDWLKCEAYALSNIAKKVCEYWKENGQNITIKDLEDVFKIERKALTNYIKKGSRIGWCNYNIDDENKKGRTKGAITNSRKINMFKGGVLLGEFQSSKVLSENSERLFLKKLEVYGIRRNARGESKSYKGFTFKYVE